MKKLIYGTLFLTLVGIGVIGCQKEHISQQQTSGSAESVTQVLKSVVYASLTCELANGQTGCQCAVTQSDDDCSEQTACTAQSLLPNYSHTLATMFTAKQIQDRADHKVRITEPDLIAALKLDNFPLK